MMESAHNRHIFFCIVTLILRISCSEKCGCSCFTIIPSSSGTFMHHQQEEHHRYHDHQQLQSKKKNRETNTASHIEEESKPLATIAGYISQDEEIRLIQILNGVGFEYIFSSSSDDVGAADVDAYDVYKYKYIKASGMLKLVQNEAAKDGRAPKWIPTQSGEENVLVANGWSFLDPDESEPMSAFDIDAANEEGQYLPKWGINGASDCDDKITVEADEYVLSMLGFNIQPLTKDEVLSDADQYLLLPSSSRSVLLDGATDEPNVKVTNNNFDFSGSVRIEDIQKGLFVCPIGGLPLFTTDDLSPTTASSGWLSFVGPVSNDHVRLIHPEPNAMDQRIEVVCAKSGCHLGHYFGRGEGYCINASALNFIPTDGPLIQKSNWNDKTNPISWHTLTSLEKSSIRGVDTIRNAILRNISTKKICLGAGCFWHVEFALRRLPGVINTSTGYCGGLSSSPSYKEVCSGTTNHAEVVMCHFDPSVLEPMKLLDCFLAMHDPTSVRAHGKRAVGTGQYRSCIFVFDDELLSIANEAARACSKQLAKLLCTEVRNVTEDSFWMAESRHQRHDERVKSHDAEERKTIKLNKWLMQYGRRSSSIWGSSESILVDDSDDDGMARMMI